MTSIVAGHDGVLFDLDGVVYVGPDAVPAAPATIAALKAAGVRVGYVTNNASRSPATVAEHLCRLGIEADESEVVTSAQAIGALMSRDLEPGSPVFVLGAAALAAELEQVGLSPVWDHEAEVAAVVMGYNPAWTILDLQRGCHAINRGVPWYAANEDLSIPTQLGMVPGMGSWINAMSPAVGGRRPDAVAGKPHRELLATAMTRLAMSNPLFVGDRLDTDIEGANVAGIDSLLVLASGSHRKRDLLAAPPQQRPTHLGLDVAALLEPAPAPENVIVRDGAITIARVPATLAGQLAAVHAIARASWADPTLDVGVVEQLTLVP